MDKPNNFIGLWEEPKAEKKKEKKESNKEDKKDK